MPVKLLRRERLYASARLSFDLETYDTPTGQITRPLVHHPGSVVLLALPSPDTVLLVRQYRFSLGRWTLELPAGTRTPGEPPEETAKRELAEETGFSPGRLELLARFWPAPGVSDEEMLLYRATDLTPSPLRPDPGELVRPEVLSREAAKAVSGELMDLKTLYGLGWL